MAKWAVGLRLKKLDIRKVEAALEKGEILRTHVLRPSWHTCEVGLRLKAVTATTR